MTGAAHRQALLILDVDDDLFEAEVGPVLPAGVSREVLSLSRFGARRLHRATKPEEPVDWPALCHAVNEMAARARELRTADGAPTHYYVCGKAPLPLFLLLARDLSARSEPQTFVGWSREAGWCVFPLSEAGVPKGGFFDIVRGLSETSSSEPPRRGMVALFISTLGGPVPEGMLRDLIQREGEDVAGVVEVRTSRAVFVNPEDVSAATGQLGRTLSQIPLFYPAARGVAVFVAGPALLAFLVGRLLPSTLGEVWFANHRPFFKDYERAYASPRNPRFAAPTTGDFSPAVRKVVVRGLRGIDEVTFDLPAPEPGAAQHVLVLGENGTGKTTLLRALAFAFLDPKITDVALQQSVSRYRRTRGGDGVSESVVETDQGVFHTELGTHDALETAVARSPREGGRPFVLAYGCRRGSATGSPDRDPAATPFDDVGNLFDRPWGLVHAEAWLRNLHSGGDDDSSLYQSVERAVLRVLPGVDALFFAGSTLRARAKFEHDPSAPEVDFAAIEGTVGVAQALTFAARRAERVVVANNGLRAKLSDAAKTRRALLASAVALAEGGVIDAGEVARIRKGRGPMDTAQDCIDLAALFRANAARIQGRTTVTAEQLRDAAKLGNELVAALTPAGAKIAAPTKEVAPEAEMRDRMAVLLARRYFEVERAAGWLWGRALDEHVSALLARSPLSRKRAKTPAEPPPAAPK